MTARAAPPETLSESRGDGRQGGRGQSLLVPRLVRVMRYEELEAGGGPAVTLEGPLFELGRGDVERIVRDAAGGSLEVTDPLMSRRHARILAPPGGGWIVEDLGSRNGTFVEGRPIRREPLEDGQLIETGRTAWLFRLAPSVLPMHAVIGPTRSYSPSIVTLSAQLSTLAPASVSILLSGETGTGKEIFAREVHARSGRAGRFVAVNCGALTEALLESELFGHRRGAFTGALADRTGLVEAAHGGTLFLDEIGEMPASAQVRLLRVLQEGEVVPVGDTSPRKVDVRVVAATHRDLASMVADKRFREDLYARLDGWTFGLPRLAERREDLGEIIAHAVRASGAAHAKATVRAARALLAFDWPFNIRQLLKTIEAALALAQGSPIDLEHLPARIRDAVGSGAPARTSAGSAPPRATGDSTSPKVAGATVPPRAAGDTAPPRAGDTSPPRAGDTAPPLALDAEESELREKVVTALRAHGGNVTRAAQALGKQRQQMQRWMRRFGIRAEDYGGSD